MKEKMKVKRYLRSLLLLLWLPAIFVFQACPDNYNGNDDDLDAKVFLRQQYMNVYYYWRDQVLARNTTIDPGRYDIEDYFDELLYSRDRWSWMCDRDEYIADETGVVSGTWGVSIGQAIEGYRDYGLHVRYIHPGSPLERFGVTRGAVLTRMDGFNVEDDDEGFTSEKADYFNKNFYSKTTQTFTFRLADGRDTTFTATMAASLNTRTALITDIIRPEDYPGLTRPVGYFHYLAFKNNFLSDISGAMTTFHDQGIRDLIVDLRYNGGGDSRASDTLMTYLAPASAVGKPYVVRHHNSYLASLDDSFTDAENTMPIGSNANALSLDHIYFITGAGSASASEMVINGLRPYMGDKLQMVGDTTYGKPNGMYVLLYPYSKDDIKRYNNDDYSRLEWVFLPIAFFNNNSEGEAIPETGFVPNYYCPDDLNHDFGVAEAAVNACLTHLTTGVYPPSVAHSSAATKAARRSGYRIDMEEDSPNYGSYRVRERFF